MLLLLLPHATRHPAQSRGPNYLHSRSPYHSLAMNTLAPPSFANTAPATHHPTHQSFAYAAAAGQQPQQAAQGNFYPQFAGQQGFFGAGSDGAGASSSPMPPAGMLQG